MARRILNRKDLRAQAEAAERRDTGETEVEEEDEDEEDDETAEVSDDDEAVAEEEAEEDDEEVDEEVPKKKKKAVAKPKPKAKAKPRSRTAKVVRMRAIWGVFNNSNQRVAVFDYPKRKEADDHAAKLTLEKKGNSSTFFVQLVKEPIEEKKEKE